MNKRVIHLNGPVEVYTLLENAVKAKKVIGWDPKVSLSDLIAMLVETDLQSVQSGARMSTTI